MATFVVVFGSPGDFQQMISEFDNNGCACGVDCVAPGRPMFNLTSHFVIYNSSPGPRQTLIRKLPSNRHFALRSQWFFLVNLGHSHSQEASQKAGKAVSKQQERHGWLPYFGKAAREKQHDMLPLGPFLAIHVARACKHCILQCTSRPTDEILANATLEGIQSQPVTQGLQGLGQRTVSCPALCVLVMSMQGVFVRCAAGASPSSKRLAFDLNDPCSCSSSAGAPQVPLLMLLGCQSAQQQASVGRVGAGPPSCCCGSKVLLPAGQTSATAAVAAPVWSRCLTIRRGSDSTRLNVNE
eukprot:1157305-Pelagomonas_calceolata.AAC.18